jgi:cytochrome c-type protein NapC
VFTKIRPSLGYATGRTLAWGTATRVVDESVWAPFLSRRTLLDSLRRARRNLIERVLGVLGKDALGKYRPARTCSVALAPAAGLPFPAPAGTQHETVFDRVRGALSRRLPGYAVFTFIGSSSLLTLAAGGLLVFGGQAAFHATNTEQFCVSCHEMRDNNFKEYKGSIHDSNRTGVRATCPDCHVPKETGPALLAKAGAAVDLYSHFVSGGIDTKAKFNAERSRMAQKVWMRLKETDSRECRNCHDATSMMNSENHAPAAKSRHTKGLAQGKTCIDCHYGIAHNEPTDGPSPDELHVSKR